MFKVKTIVPTSKCMRAHCTRRKSIVSSLNLLMAHVCSNNCRWCKILFTKHNEAYHIGHIKNINKRNTFLKMKSFLKIDSCLCDGCWNLLERIYKSNQRKRRSISSGSNYVGRDFQVELTTQCLEKFENRNQTFTCSVYNCKQEFGLHPLSLNEFIQINEILLKADIHTIILIKSQKWGSNQRGPILSSVCEEHFKMINILITCQLCGNKPNTNLDIGNYKIYDQWNHTLKRNDIPLKLLPGMCLCDTCQSFASNSVDFPTIVLDNFRKNVKKRNDICMKLFERPENEKIDTKKKKLGSVFKVSFKDPLKISHLPYKCNINNHSLEKKLDEFKRSSIYSKVKPNLVRFKDKLLPSTNENINNDKDNHTSSRIKVIDIHNLNGIKVHDSLKTLTEKKKYLTSFKKCSDDLSSGSYDHKHNGRVRKLMDLATKNVNVKPSILPQNNEDSPVRLIEHADLVISTIENHSDDIFTINQNAATAKIDNKTDSLPFYVSTADNNNSMPIIGYVFSLSSDSLKCKTKDINTDRYNSLTTFIPTAKSNIDILNTMSDEETEACPNLILQQNNVVMTENIKKNNYMPVVDSVFSQSNDQAVCKNSDETDHSSLLISHVPSLQSIIDLCSDSDKELEDCPDLFSQLKNVKMLENIQTHSATSVVRNEFSKSNNQTLCKAYDEKTDYSNPLISDVPSVQSNINVHHIVDEETEEYPELFSSDSSSSDSDDVNEYITKNIIFEKKILNESDHNTNVLLPKIPLNLSVLNPTEVIKRSSDVINKRFRGTKKQRFNGTLLNQANSLFVNNRIKDNTIDSNKHININSKSSNSPGAFNIFSHTTNKNIPNLDYNAVYVKDMSFDKDNQTVMSIGIVDSPCISSDKYKEIIVTHDSADFEMPSNPCDEDESVISNDSIDVEKISSDEEIILVQPNDEYEEIIVTHDSADLEMPSNPCDEDQSVTSNDSIDVEKIFSDEEIIMVKPNDTYSTDNLSPTEFSRVEPSFHVKNNDSLEPLQLQQTSKIIHGSTDKITFSTNKNNNTVNSETVPCLTISSDDEISSRFNKFPRLPKSKSLSKYKNNKDDHLKELRLDLDQHKPIYENLLTQFHKDTSAVISYLMENERLLYSGQLVVSRNADPHVKSYIQKHLKVLFALYGDPKDHNLSESFIYPSYKEARLYSQRLSSEVCNLLESEESFVSSMCSPPASLENISSSLPS